MLLGLKRKRILSSDTIEKFCSSIQYFDKVELPHSYYSSFYVNFEHKTVFKANCFYDALSFIIQNLPKIKRMDILYMSISMEINCIRLDDDFDLSAFNGYSIEELKNKISNKANERYIYFSHNMDKTYGEYFDVCGINYTFDYDLLYGNINIPKPNIPYVSTIIKNNYNTYYSYNGKIIRPKAKNPCIITQSEIDIMNSKTYRHSLRDFIYGVEGFFQYPHNGSIMDWDTMYGPSLRPICTLIEASPRPKVKGISRYKVSLKFIQYGTDDTEIQDSIYVECNTGDLEMAKKIAINGNWNCNDDGITITSIELVPDGKWII